MQTITLVLATPGKFTKKTVEVSSVATLRALAAELAARPAAEVRLLWRGQLLQDTCQLDTVNNNGLVTIATVRPPAAPAPPLNPVTITDAEADRFRVAFGSALRNPAFNKVVRRLLHRENMESLAAACPGLQEDLVAQAFLTRPELLQQLLNPDTLKHIGSVHPALCEAAHNLAAAVHEEAAAAARSGGGAAAAAQEPRGSSGSYYLDEMSDEEMEEDEQQQPQQQQQQGARPRQAFSITPEQLASALSSVQTSGGSGRSLATPFQGVTGLAPPTRPGEGARQSAPTTPHSARITADMFQAAMQAALSGMGAAAVQPAAAPEPARPDWSAQLRHMREMGIVDEGLATRALQVMDGDLQAAVDLIFSGWLGDDISMQ